MTKEEVIEICKKLIQENLRIYVFVHGERVEIELDFFGTISSDSGYVSFERE